MEKTFTRVYDFEVHVRSHHPDIPWKGPEYFTRTAGFYYALYPEDYARIVEHVVPYDSDIGYRIRKAMRTWAEGFEDKKERLEKWNRGWKDEVAVADRRARRSVSRSVSKEKERDSRIVVSGADKGANNSGDSDRRNERKQTEEPNSRKRRGTEDEPRVTEKLKRPEVGDEGLDGYTVDIELMEDPQKLNNALDAVVASMNDGTVGSGTLNGDVNMDAGAGTRKVIENVGDVGEAGNSGDGVGIDAGTVTRSVEDVDEAGDSGDSVRVEESVEKSKVTRSIDDVDKAGDSGANETGAGVLKSVCDSGVSVEKGVDAVKNGVNMNVGDEGGTCDLGGKVGSDVTGKSRDRDDETESSSSSGSSSPGSTSARTSDSIRSRAMRILTRGAMPLCPPARRIWTRSIEIEVNGRKYLWPPANWRALSPDSRLFAIEQIALALERGESDDFPRMSRKTLVDKYAFLMLAGQAKPTVESTESEKVPDKLRQYNLSYLKGLVKGDIGDSRTAWSIVKTLDRSDRWLDTDEVIDSLEAGGVKIKV